MNILKLFLQSTSFGEGGPNTWNVSESSEEEEVSDIEITDEIKKEENKIIDNIGIFHTIIFIILFFVVNN